VINSGRLLRPETGVRRLCVRALLAAIVLSALITQTAVAQMAGEVRLEQVSPRMLRVPGPGGTVRTVPDLAAAGQVLVRMAPTATPADLERLLAATNTQVIKAYSYGNRYLLRLPEGQRVNDGVNAISGRGGVGIVSPDRAKYIMRVPNDTRYDEQWHWPLIKATEAWDVQTGSTTSVVAVVDSGVDLDHPDLMDRIWVNQDEIAGDGTDNDQNGYVDDVVGWDFVNGNNDPMPNPSGEDDHGVTHGSHCAGIIGATTDNNEGVAGHDWNCRIMALQVMSHTGEGFDSWIIGGIEYAIDNGANVVSLSLGGGWSDQYTDLFATAVAAGVTIVAAAGNDAWVFTDDPLSWMSPVCNDGPNFTDNNVIGVGATDRYDHVTYFSNVDNSSRNFVDVMAPGQDILSTLYYDPDHPEFGFISPYGQMSGTSMACPVVAGLASLIHAHFPASAPAGILSQIRTAADNIDDLNPSFVGMMGAGRVNSQNCLQDLPPALPRTVTAYDTPDDDGGSITVAWSLSADDGKGFNDVIGYRVQRSESDEVASFVTVKSLDPGIATYVDSPVDDDKSYYYRLGVRDASTEVFTDPTLPAQSRDDTAPPALEEGMLVVDVYGRDGGAIELTWTDYVPPGDFAAYRVWRADAPFTDVTALAQPIATIEDEEQKSYIDKDDPATDEAEVVDGKEYYYAVTVQDDATVPNEITEVICAGPVVANPIFLVRFPQGLSMIAIGVKAHNNNMGNIFGVDDPADLPLARWDPTLGSNGGYVVYSESPNSTFLQQQLGRGFWYRTPTAKELNISGESAPPGNVSVNFSPGWNQLGNPYVQDMPIAGAKVTVFGSEMDLATSNSTGYTRDYVWGYDPFTGSYKLISAYMPFAKDQVPKDEGFYFRAFEQGTLELPRPTVGSASSRQAASAKPVVDEEHWFLRLVAQTGDAADTDNFVGVNPQAEKLSGVLCPPPPDGGINLAVATAGRNYSATSFVKSVDSLHTWQVRVTAAEPGQTVQLSWPDLSQVPPSCKLTLTDLEAGGSVNMRTTTGYSYQLGAEHNERHFEVVVSERGASALTVSGLQAMSTGGGRAQICFTLSQDAAVDVEILNIAGRSVRRLAADRLLAAGANVVLWDQQADNGTRVPRGRYLVCVVAKTDDGSVAKAIGALQIQR